MPTSRLARRGTDLGVTPTGTLARMCLDELERRLRERLDALGPAPRAELLHVLMLPGMEMP
jgi:hypothetical protein